MNAPQMPAGALPYHTGDVLLCRESHGGFNLYSIDDIEWVLNRDSRDGRKINLYNPMTDVYFAENEGDGTQESPSIAPSDFVKSIVGVMDGNFPDETHDPLSVVVEPVILLNDNSLLSSCKTVHYMQPDAYAVKSSGRVRGLFKESDSAEVYARILKNDELKAGMTPQDKPFIAWNLAWMDAFNGGPKQQKAIQDALYAVKKAQECFSTLYHEYPDLQDLSLKSVMGLGDIHHQLKLATKNILAPAEEEVHFAGTPQESHEPVAKKGHKPESL